MQAAVAQCPNILFGQYDAVAMVELDETVEQDRAWRPVTPRIG
jgi:hypothetical protein